MQTNAFKPGPCSTYIQHLGLLLLTSYQAINTTLPLIITSSCTNNLRLQAIVILRLDLLLGRVEVGRIVVIADGTRTFAKSRMREGVLVEIQRDGVPEVKRDQTRMTSVLVTRYI